MNILAAMTKDEDATNQVYNVAVGDRTSLEELYELILGHLADHISDEPPSPRFLNFRSGDVKHSQADIGNAQELLGYQPSHRIKQGLKEVMAWYVNELNDTDLR